MRLIEMTKALRFIILTISLFFIATTSYAILIPTANKNVGFYLGLFGSTDNPAQHTGCYVIRNSSLTGKQFIEYSYTAMDCSDGVSKIVTPGMLASTDASMIDGGMDDFLQHVLTKASAIQLGIDFSFNS